MQSEFPPLDSNQALNQNLPTQNSTRKRIGSTPSDAKVAVIEHNIRAENKIEVEAEKINPDAVKNLTDNLNDKKLSKEKQVSTKILKGENVSSSNNNSNVIKNLQDKVNNSFKDSPISSNTQKNYNSSTPIFEELTISKLEEIIEKSRSGENQVIVNISDKRIKFKIGKLEHKDDAIFSDDRILMTEALKNKYGNKIDKLPIEYDKNVLKADKAKIKAFEENKIYSVITNEQFDTLKNILNNRIQNERPEKSKTDNLVNKSTDNLNYDFHSIKLESSHNVKIKDIFIKYRSLFPKLSSVEIEKSKDKKANEIRYKEEATENKLEREHKIVTQKENSIRERMERNLKEEIKKTSQD